MKIIGPLDEKLILQKVSTGDTDAFRDLFNAYKDKVYSYALHFTRNEADAEELTQEVFMRVWIKKEQLAEVANFEAWVFTITRNLSFNALKKMSRVHNLHQEYAAIHKQQSPDLPAPDDNLLYQENEAFLRQAVSRLPHQQKIVFELYKDRHLKIHEIAKQLHISPSTVKTHLAMAKRSVRTYIQAWIEPAVLAIIIPWLF